MRTSARGVSERPRSTASGPEVYSWRTRDPDAFVVVPKDSLTVPQLMRGPLGRLALRGVHRGAQPSSTQDSQPSVLSPYARSWQRMMSALAPPSYFCTLGSWALGPRARLALDAIEDVLAVAAAILICRHAFLDSGQLAGGGV